MKIRVSPALTRTNYFGVGCLIFLIVEMCRGLTGIKLFLAIIYTVVIGGSIWKEKEYLVIVSINPKQVSSRLLFKERCTVYYDRPVYIAFFKEEMRGAPNEKYHVMISNFPLPNFVSGKRHAAYDRSKQIIFPDTEKTRQAIAPLLSSEFCILQGDAPPPLEELRKKKEKKEEPPVVKREKSPDDPPPFTGKWNGRF